MVKFMGHLGVALIWAIPAWFVWEPRESAAFVGLVLATASLPDVDLVLENFLPVTHHGVTHTVVFVTAVSLTAGAVVVFGLERVPVRDRLRRHGVAFSVRPLYAFVSGGFLLGGLSHLFVDMLSAPDIAKPVEPFWPLFDKPWSVDLIWYASFEWNVGLLAVGLLAHLGLAYVDVRFDHPYRLLREV